MPCRFARQFGYDQMYVGNPNTKLGFKGSLIDGARAWRHFLMGCTKARFILSLQDPRKFLTLGFCKWYFATYSVHPDFKCSSSFMTLVLAKHRQEKRAKEKLANEAEAYGRGRGRGQGRGKG